MILMFLSIHGERLLSIKMSAEGLSRCDDLMSQPSAGRLFVFIFIFFQIKFVSSMFASKDEGRQEGVDTYCFPYYLGRKVILMFLKIYGERLLSIKNSAEGLGVMA